MIKLYFDIETIPSAEEEKEMHARYCIHLLT